MLEKKIKTSNMPEQAHKVCVKEIKRFVSIFILLANVKSYLLVEIWLCCLESQTKAALLFIL